MTNQKELIFDDQFSEKFDRIEKNSKAFQYGDTADSKTISEVRNLININQLRNNKIILFFPPFAPVVAKKMISSGKCDYMKDASVKVSSICVEFGVPFFDFTEASEFNDDAFIDCFYAGQKVYYEIAQRFPLKTESIVFSNNFESASDSQFVALRKKFFSK